MISINGDICYQDLQDKFIFLQILPNGFQKINGPTFIDSFMELVSFNILREFKIILWKIIKTGKDYLIVQLLIAKFYLPHTKKHYLHSKKSLSWKPLDRIRLFHVFKILCLSQWEKSSSLLQHSTFQNVTEIHQLLLLSFSCFLQVVTPLLTFWSSQNKWIWLIDIVRFLWAKVKVKKLKLLFSKVIVKVFGFYYKTVTCQ